MILHPTPQDYRNAKAAEAEAIRRRDHAEDELLVARRRLARIAAVCDGPHRSPDWHGRDARRRLNLITRILKENQ